MMTTLILLFISMSLNLLLIWYCRKLTAQFLFFTQNIIELENKLNSFDEHLNGVHQLETFYGDDTLGSLIQHSRKLIESIKEFNNSFILDEETIEDQEDYEEDQ